MSGHRGTTIAIVQARTTSQRLPGKVLMELQEAPMILRQLERVRRAENLDRIVVATSDDHTDDALAQLVQEAGYDTVRGPLDDVLARFLLAIETYQPDVVVRITADCPLISPSVIDHIVEAFHDSDFDYLSNTMVATYPDGLDVEVVTAQALRQIASVNIDVAEREHVTLGIYRRPEQFNVGNVVDPIGRDHSDLRWTVDTPEDFEFVTRIYAQLFPQNPGFDYDDVLALLAHRPEWNRTVADGKRNAALDGLDTGVMQR